MLHEIEQLSPEEWNAGVDKLYHDFPEGGLSGILPPHFVRATFPKIGGKIIHTASENLTHWGLLLPRDDREGADWTLRCHWKGDSKARQKLKGELDEFITANVSGLFNWFEVDEKRQEDFRGSVYSRQENGKSIRFPSREEAIAAQDLHRKIWQVEDLAFLYPFDLYHPDAGMATKLVAVDKDITIGFLFGFYGKGQQWFGQGEGYHDGIWIESQLLGVDKDYRQSGVAKELKQAQRSLALSQGVQIVHWTVDPLQAGNAWLNFNHLGALAVQFYPDYYKFSNALNRASASRIGISWVLNSRRAENCAHGEPLTYNYDCLIHDSSTETVSPISAEDWTPAGDTVLVEIPRNWTEMQQTQPDLAVKWRNASDYVFRRLLEYDPYRYAIVGIVKDGQSECVFLVAKRITSFE